MTDVLDEAPAPEAQAAGEAAPPSAPPPTATATEPSAASGWGAEIVTLATLLAVVAFGDALFYRTPIALPLGAVAGLLAGVCLRRWWSAPIVAAIGTVVGAVLATFTGGLVLQAWGLWLPGTFEAAAIAAVLSAGAVVLRARMPRAEGPLVVLAVLAVIAAMWGSGIAQATQATSGGQTSVARLAEQPKIDLQMTDETTYILWIDNIRAGQPYYRQAVATFLEQDRVFGDRSLVRVNSPLSYRPPTLYYLLATLPPGIADVYAMLLLCSFGVGAAFVLARQHVGRGGALLAAVLAASMFSGFGSVQLLEAESWAGVLVLCAVAAFVLARRMPEPRTGLDLAAVALAVLAVAFREIALPVVLLGLVASVSTAEERASNSWRVWAGGCVLAILGLGAHWLAAAQAFAGAASHPVASTWFHPNGSGLVGAMFLVDALMALEFGSIALLTVLGLVGSLAAPEDRSSRIMVAGVATGGAAALMFFHPPGWTVTHAAPGYWGFIIYPTLLACVPLAFAWVGRWKRVPGA